MKHINTNKTVAAIAAGLLIAACGGSDDADSTTEPQIVVQGAETDANDVIVDDASNATASDQTEEEQALAFAECMRGEGLDWPDPLTNSDGSIDLLGGRDFGPAAGGGGIDDATEAGLNVCGPLIEGASFLPGGGEGIDAETQDSFLEFTQCLRDNGVDVDDPDLGNLGGGGGFPGAGGGGGPLGDFDPSDPANAEAINACQGLFAGIGG